MTDQSENSHLAENFVPLTQKFNLIFIVVIIMMVFIRFIYTFVYAELYPNITTFDGCPGVLTSSGSTRGDTRHIG